ncbi:MAG TPA: ATP-binding protein [Gemmatimonadota bacterium]|nr:ATP-binding protein [Gemmatimonadota bacterium]
MRKISLRQALVASILAVLLLGLVPAGIALDRRLAAELERKARSDLAMAPRILGDRESARSDALMMQAKELAGAADVVAAVDGGRRERAVAAAAASLTMSGERPVLLGADGRAWTDPAPDPSLVEATRRGETPVRFQYADGRLVRVALAPVRVDGTWRGAAGVLVPWDQAVAGTLAGLTRADVVLLGADGAMVAASSETPAGAALADSAAAWAAAGGVHEVADGEGRRYWVAAAPLEGRGSVAFVRSVASEMAVLPGLRRSAALAVAVALGVALLVAVLLAARMARPVQGLAAASRRLADGDFDAPVPDSALREVDQVARAFRDMRVTLAEKIRELTRANRELEDRQARLQALQGEILQRDRLAATGRVITELAHEIRNPVAGVRNCLEILHRRLDPDSGLREFSEMAIEELMRMHELAESMLDANRPLDPEADRCDPVAVAGRVADLARTARDRGGPAVEVSGPEGLSVSMGPDVLKQVLLNLVENAREAIAASGPGPDGSGRGSIEIEVRADGADPGDGDVVLEVRDDGPGFAEGVLERIFDPFFTTKDEVHGVGLGLFVAEGLVRRHGGAVTASNRRGGGARVILRLPTAEEEA